MTAGEKVEIPVIDRSSGKHHSRSLRRDRRVPAVVYGPKMENLNFSLAELDAQRYAMPKYENTIFKLKSDNPKLNQLQVLKKAIVYHKVTRRPVHMDFYALDMKETVKVNVEIRFDGKAEGLREGGIFNVLRRDIEIESLPAEIPEAFTVDISNMQLNDTLHVSDLKISDSIKVITSAEEAICSITEPKAEAVAETPDAAADAGAEQAPAEAKATEEKK